MAGAIMPMGFGLMAARWGPSPGWPHGGATRKDRLLACFSPSLFGGYSSLLGFRIFGTVVPIVPSQIRTRDDTRGDRRGHPLTYSNSISLLVPLSGLHSFLLRFVGGRLTWLLGYIAALSECFGLINPPKPKAHRQPRVRCMYVQRYRVYPVERYPG